jgi:eukaryotic-like serine/threonine-protein kinase
MAPTKDGQSGFVPGTILGDRFRIVRLVGSGGMGVVYEAVDVKLDHRVALKCARPGHYYRLPPEARAAREVSHFNVCKVYDLHTFDTADGPIDCLSMEYVEGETLSQHLRSNGAVTGRTARDLAQQICAGLTQAHRQGVIHGDLKSGNVMLARSPEGRTRAVITDFGLAHMADETAENRRAQGTYNYMAPECFLGEPPTVASDVYALGVLFHVMLAGHPPRRIHASPEAPHRWEPDSHADTRTAAKALVESEWRREVKPLPAPWKKIVSRCLAANPEQRPGSVSVVAQALEPRRTWLKVAGAVIGAAILIVVGREWRSRLPVTPVRLAVLPFSIEGDGSANIAGIGAEVSDRLSGARRKFTVISPREAGQNLATTAEKARTNLGATHVLDTHARISSGSIAITASVVDLQSGGSLGELQGNYSAGDGAVLAKALVGTVSTAFRLPKAIAKESVSPAAYGYYAQGIDLLRRDGAVFAEQVTPMFNRAIELDPKSALPLAGLAEAQIQRFERGDGTQWLDQAEATVAKATSLNPDSVPVLLAAGYLQQQRGHFEQAIQQLTRATELAPDDSEVWRRLALCYAGASRFDEAVATFQKANAAQPDDYRQHLSFGTLFFNRGQFSRAEEEYRRVTAIAPALASGHMDLGLALEYEGRFPEAESQLLEALKLQSSPTPNLLVNVGSLYYAEGRFEESGSFFEKSVEQSIKAGTPSALQYRGLGDANRHLGRDQQAREAYDASRKLATQDVTRNPRRAASHSQLGVLYALLKDNERAAFELSQALSLDPENRSVMRDAAIGYEIMGRRDDALAALRKAPQPLLQELSRQPDVKSLQSDSRFRTLLTNTPAQ